MKNDTPVADLPNIGAVTASWLTAIGIRTRADLEAAGPVLAYKILSHQQSGVTANLLYALYGALHDRPWNSLTPAEKARLKQEASGPLDILPGPPSC